MSFGVCASERDSAFDYETVCAEADAALYEAKRGPQWGVRRRAGRQASPSAAFAPTPVARR